MTNLSQRVLKMQESATLAMAQKSRELKQKGVDIISLSLGEPDFDTPELIKKAAKAALDAGDTKYTPVSGTLALREAICAKLLRENHLTYTPQQIVVSNGAKQAIANACMALLDPGDEIILPSPYWISYASIAELAGAVVVEIKADVSQNYKITANQLADAITPKTKVILYSAPCNPTGVIYSQSELQEFVDIIVQHPQIHIISDEIYEHINYVGRHTSIANFEEIRNRVVLVNGFSKAYSMTGWRLGYIAASEPIAKACDKIQGQITSGACSFNQAAAIAALNYGESEVSAMKQAFERRRSLVIDRISQIPNIKCPKPDGAFYVFPDVSSYFGLSYGENVIRDSEDMAMYLLTEAHVATVGGKDFGDSNCIRISFAASEDHLNIAFDRISLALSNLKAAQ